MKKIRKRIQVAIVTILMFFGIASLHWDTTFAASASIDCKVLSSNIQVGDTFSVSITISSSTNLGDFEANITYDNEMVEFIGGGSYLHGSNGNLVLSDSSFESGTTKKKYVLEFKALKEGETKVALDGTPTVFDYESGAGLSVSGNDVVVEIGGNKKADAKLSAISISAGTLSPSFHPTTYEYAVEVKNSVESVKIVPTTSSKKAKATVTGGEQLDLGENKIVISVVAENGEKKEYVIYVKRQEESTSLENTVLPESSQAPDGSPLPDTTQHPEDTMIPDEDNLSEVHCKKEGDDTLLFTNQSYVVVDGEVAQVPTGYEETILTIDGIDMKAYQDEVGQESEMYLVYAKMQDGDAMLYQVDKKEYTIQRYVDQTYKQSELELKVQEQKKEYESKINMLQIVTIILCVLSISLMLVVIRFIMKARGMKDEI